jgi:hypothetical protein
MERYQEQRVRQFLAELQRRGYHISEPVASTADGNPVASLLWGGEEYFVTFESKE